MEKCVFCEIIATHSRSEHTIFEDKEFIVILDDFPLAKGHTLVILKDHKSDITSVSPDDAADMGRVVAVVAAALKLALQAKLVYVASLGEQVKHVHYHLVPRYEDDERGFCHFMSPRGKLTEGAEMVEKIQAKLWRI